MHMRLAVGVVLLSWVSMAGACSIVRLSCNFLDDKSPVVFVGTVISPDDPETEVLLHRFPVIFNVTERLRGDIGKQISIYEPGTSCDFKFELGKSYLVFAYFENGRLITSELTSTRETLTAGALLRQLRAINQGRSAVSLIGYLGDGGPTSERAMTGITIVAKSKHQTFAARTGEDGSFEFSYLPPGVYRIKAQLPKGYAPTGTYARIEPGQSCDLQYMWAFQDKGR